MPIPHHRHLLAARLAGKYAKHLTSGCQRLARNDRHALCFTPNRPIPIGSVTKGGTVPKTYTGLASGVGAAAEWNGSGRAGAAKMLITESVVPSKVSVQVDWIKPFRAHNLNEFTIHAQGDDTQVPWSIQASNLYAMKLIGIFVNIESQFGQHMESGLNNLKRAAEKEGIGS